MGKVLVLSETSVEGVTYPAGAVVDLPDDLAKSLKSTGYIDDHKNAVAGKDAVKHKPKAETAEDPGAKKAETR